MKEAKYFDVKYGCFLESLIFALFSSCRVCFAAHVTTLTKFCPLAENNGFYIKEERVKKCLKFTLNVETRSDLNFVLLCLQSAISIA